MMFGTIRVALYMSLIVIMTAGFCMRAQAQWAAHTEGPDVFGNTTVIAAGASSSGNGFVVQCDGADLLELAFIMPGTPSELDEVSSSGVDVPATLLVRVDNGAVTKLDAHLKQWNNKYLGVVATGRIPELAAIVHAIGAAGKIGVGVDVLSDRQSESFGSIGSTTAMNTVIKVCKLNEIGAAPANGGTAAPK